MKNQTLQIETIFSRDGRAYRVFFDEKTKLWQNYNEVQS